MVLGAPEGAQRKQVERGLASLKTHVLNYISTDSKASLMQEKDHQLGDWVIVTQLPTSMALHKQKALLEM